jgi:hypothetical protein
VTSSDLMCGSQRSSLIGSPAWAPMYVAERRCGHPRFSRRNRTDIASWICLHRPERPSLLSNSACWPRWRWAPRVSERHAPPWQRARPGR